MARNVYFAFHYDDVFKVNSIRQNWRFNNDSRFNDWSMWEKAKIEGDEKVKKLIDEKIIGSGVTCVLIGTETFKRKWVKYELIRSFEKGNGVLGIHINKIRGNVGIKNLGKNPLDFVGLKIDEEGDQIHFYHKVDKKWRAFSPFPKCNNNKGNTIYFKEKGAISKLFGQKEFFGESFKFSELFKTYRWKKDNGNENIEEWVEEAARKRNIEL